MLRSLLATTVALTLFSAPAFAAETGPGYAPSATVSVGTPAYAPPPTYAAPPPPQYGAPPPQYGAPPPQYGSPPASRYAVGFEIARPGWSISVMAGFGFDSVYNFGIGARAGYTLPQHFYIGGEFGYFFGGSEGIYSYATYNLGPEFGYDIGLAAAPVLIRPYAGLGYDGVTVSGVGCAQFCASGTGGFAFWGGAMSTYNFTKNWSAGVDLRVIIPTFGTGNGATNYAAPGIVAFTLSAMGSYKF